MTRDPALLAICALGFVLGCYGIWWGWVECWNPDQMALLPVRGFLEPTTQMKPPFHTYLNFFLVVVPVKVLGKLIRFVTGTNVDLDIAILFLSRFVQLLLFVGVIYLSYRIVRRPVGQLAGRLIALFTATSAGFVLHAHYLTADIPVTFWMLSSFCVAQSIAESGRMRDYVLAGLLTGIATATKYNGLAVGLAIPLFHWFANRNRPFLRIAFDRRLVIGVAFVVVGFILADPYAVLNYKEFAADFYYNFMITPVYNGQAEGNGYALFLVRIIEILGLPLAVIIFAGVTGTLVYARRWEHLQRATVGAALGVLLLYSYNFGAFPRLPMRFVLPVVPFLLFAAAPALTHVFSLHRRFASAVIVAVVAYNTIASVWVGYRFAHDPRMAAQAWVARNVPAGTIIESSLYSPDWNKYPGIKVNDSRMPSVYGKRIRLSRVFAAGSKIFRMVQDRESDADQLGWYDAQALSTRQPHYIALDSLYYERFLVSPNVESYPQVAGYFRQLLAGELGYQIVFDRTAIGAPMWLYLVDIGPVDNRIVILKRVRENERVLDKAAG